MAYLHDKNTNRVEIKHWIPVYTHNKDISLVVLNDKVTIDWA